MSRIERAKAARARYWEGYAEFLAEERARDEASLPSDEEVDAMSDDLAPLMDEFNARERAKEREAV